MQGEGIGKDNPGYPFVQSLKQAGQKIIDSLLEKAQQHPEMTKKIVNTFNEHVQSIPSNKNKNKKGAKEKEELPKDLIGIFEWFSNIGFDHLEEVVKKKFKSDPTDQQQDKVDYLKELAGIETNAFIGNTLLQGLSLTKEYLLPKLFPLIEKGIQRIGAQLSKRVDTALSQASPFNPQLEAIQTAAHMVYEKAPEISGKVYEALKAIRPDGQQSTLLQSFFGSIQELFNKKDIKPTIDAIQDSMKSVKFLPSLIQSTFYMMPEHLVEKLNSIKGQVFKNESSESSDEVTRTHTPKRAHLSKKQQTKSNEARPQGANKRGPISNMKGKGKKTN